MSYVCVSISQVATIKEVLTFRLQESAVDAILTGKRKAQETSLFVLICRASTRRKWVTSLSP